MKLARKAAETNHVQPEELGARVSREAAMLVGSSFAATAVVGAYGGERTGLTNIMAAIDSLTNAVCDGDMRLIEEMLIKQAIALQTMFADLAARAKKETTMSGVHCMTQLALRTQASCRATLEAVSNMKSPRQVAFVKQTNVAHTQQVNNTSNRRPTPAGQPNKLLVEDRYGGEKLDTRAAQTTRRKDRGVEALGKIDRASD